MGTFDETENTFRASSPKTTWSAPTSPPWVGDSVLEFEDGDLVTGTVVKIDHDEVLLDIGFKSEGVISLGELSIRNDVDPPRSSHWRARRVPGPAKRGQGRRLSRAHYEKAWSNIELRTATGSKGVSSRSSRVDLSWTLVFVGLARVARRTAPRS